MIQSYAYLSQCKSTIYVKSDYLQREIWRNMTDSRWNPKLGVWEFPNKPQSIYNISKVYPIIFDDELKKCLPRSEYSPHVVAATRNDMPVKNVKPFAHQMAAYSLAVENKIFALFHDPGLGKTLTSTAIMGRHYLDGNISRVLVFAPLSVVSVWEKELAQYADYPIDARVISGTSKQKKESLKIHSNTALTVAITNYETARSLQTELDEFGADMIILDESQRIKSPDAKQSIEIQRLGVGVEYKLILTGTPIGNSPLDIWSQYKFLNPDILGSNYYACRNRYAIMGGFEGRQTIAFKNLDELKSKIYSIAHRATKDEALDLPEYTDQVLYCDFEKDARRVYKELEREAAAELLNGETITAPRIITQILRLSQACGGFIKPDDSEDVKQISKSKLKLLNEVLEDRLNDLDRKIVIFARFRAEIAEIEKVVNKALKEYEATSRTIHGDITGPTRGEYVNDFQTDPSVRVFIAQTRTAGLGITLHAADTAIFYSLDYSYQDYEQAKARIHRAGQSRNCTAIHLMVNDSIDELILQSVKNKQDISQLVIDDMQKKR